MKTDTLIDLLAQGAGPASRLPLARRLLPAWGLGCMGAAALALALVGPLPWDAFASPTPWIKLVPVALLAALAWPCLQRSARPASAVLPAQRRLQLGWLVLVLAGLGSLLVAPPGLRMAELLGRTWWVCPLMLTALALPALTLLLWAARGLPVGRPPEAGAALGLWAGCAAAAGYALVCPESSPAFVAVWYSCGLLLSTVLGAKLGQRWLRW